MRLHPKNSTLPADVADAMAVKAKDAVIHAAVATVVAEVATNRHTGL